MKRIYLTGQRTFGNRGCEAIVRSTVGLLRERFDAIEILVPSDNVDADSKQWPEAVDHGVRFVQAYAPPHSRLWTHLQRLPVRALKRAGWPFHIPDRIKDQIRSVDAILSVGGDNYSLNYHIPSLLIGMDRLGMDLGKPVILWGASIGPFEREPAFLPVVTQHLGRMSLVAARESVSYHYVTQTLGLRNAILMPDPAFTLSSEFIDTGAFWPASKGNGVLGLNISPLLERYTRSGQDLRGEVSGFIRYLVEERGLGVLLVPHVIPHGSAASNSDALYMRQLLDDCSHLGGAVTMMADRLNAAQTKGVIGRLRFFVGARTHATIAAMSSGVPTISIAYSIKARGISKDVFGTEDAVLPTHSVSALTLKVSFEWLLREESAVRTLLAIRIPQLQDAARNTAGILANVV